MARTAGEGGGNGGVQTCSCFRRRRRLGRDRRTEAADVSRALASVLLIRHYNLQCYSRRRVSDDACVAVSANWRPAVMREQALQLVAAL